MQESSDVRDSFLLWCDRLSAKDVGSFDDLVSSHPATLVIGTAPGEWVTERPRLRYGFEAEGLRLEPKNPRAHQEGSPGWPPGKTIVGRSSTCTSRSGFPMKRWSSCRNAGRARRNVHKRNCASVGGRATPTAPSGSSSGLLLGGQGQILFDPGLDELSHERSRKRVAGRETNGALGGVVGFEVVLVCFHHRRAHHEKGTMVLGRPKGYERAVELEGWVRR